MIFLIFTKFFGEFYEKVCIFAATEKRKTLYMKLDYFRVAACVPLVRPGDCSYNVDSIISIAKTLDRSGVRLGVFPELCVTGYTCGDLFLNRFMLDNAVDELKRLARQTANMKLALIVGAPVIYNNVLFNCGVVIGGGKIRMIVPKTYTPNYGEFYERRWFTPAYDAIEGTISLGSGMDDIPFGRHQLLWVDDVRVGIEICEDLWVPIPPSSFLALGGAEIIANLSASDDTLGKYGYLKTLIKQHSARTVGAYVYSSVGFGESSTDAVFDGKAIIAETGRILARNSRWQEGEQFVIADIDLESITHDRMMKNTFADCARHSNTAAYRKIEFFTGRPLDARTEDIFHPYSTNPFIPEDSEWEERCEEVTNIQAAGLAQRLSATGCEKIVLGISGGLDSTLALLVACKAFDRIGIPRKNIIGVTMPGFGTTGRTHDNAVELMKALGVDNREVSIVPGVEQHFKDIGHDPDVHDVTYENAQARMRTYLLMDIANQEGGMVLGTGDMSELALGWATFNGDHMSMYGVNAGVPKTLVRSLVEWFARTTGDEAVRARLKDIVETPISPELLPADSEGEIGQKTEDLVGPYELHDFFLYHVLRYGRSPRKIFYLAREAFGDRYTDNVVLHWLRTFFRRFFNQQFKRSCMPDGPKVSDMSLSPRSDWRMPSDASSSEWIKDIEQLEREVGVKK